MLDLVVRGGVAVTPEDITELDLGVAAGQVAVLVSAGPLEGARTIDTSGQLVLPGGVELHAHVAQRLPLEWTDGRDVWLPGPEPVTRAAAHGGTTTVLAFVLAGYDDSPQSALEQAIDTWQGESHVDFALHVTLLGAAGRSAFDEPSRCCLRRLSTQGRYRSRQRRRSRALGTG